MELEEPKEDVSYDEGYETGYSEGLKEGQAGFAEMFEEALKLFDALGMYADTKNWTMGAKYKLPDSEGTGVNPFQIPGYRARVSMALFMQFLEDTKKAGQAKIEETMQDPNG